MGSFIEINDTLQLTTEQGFPSELTLEKHLKKAFTVEDFKDQVFEFHHKPDLRIYHLKPTRVFLVHNIDGKWLYWGHAMILEETLHAETKTTSGKFIITKIYSPEHQRTMSTIEVSEGKEYPFDE
ncbi:MAG: hypothetical protein H6760_04760 [Candidatus Nomurabacteria bacterium]|nr:MAG: hypothetical protein H6760_04760 [Candidatus Nomurabacteria bacterium]